MSPASFPVVSLENYLAETRSHFVIVDPLERKRIILEETDKAAAAVGGSALRNEELLETVAFLTEYPTVVCGSFDKEYLKLPREVLVTTMISHQKYFPVVNDQGQLLPHFLTINNTLARDPQVVRRGNEKVIRARLSDARFFFETDRKILLEKRVDNLKQVVFHTLLGTSYDKVMRFRELAVWIAQTDQTVPRRSTPALWTMSIARLCSPRRTSTPRWSVNSPNSRGSWGANTPFWTEKTPSSPRRFMSIISPWRRVESFPKPTKGPSSVSPTNWTRSADSSASA